MSQISNSVNPGEETSRRPPAGRGAQQTPSRKRRPLLRAAPAAGLALALCLSMLFPTPGHAILIFDPSDPAFAGATLVTFDPNPAPGATTFTTTISGVTFTFTTTDPAGLFTCSGGNCFLQSSGSPIDVTISPPVAAIGFRYLNSECGGQATFTGSLGSETHRFFPIQRNFFVGASNIGGISSVRLDDSCRRSVFSEWDDMRFVPSSAPPPTPTPTPTPLAEADLAVTKTGPALVTESTDIFYNLQLSNAGPDTAPDARVVDFLPPGFTFQSGFPFTTVDATGRVATTRFGDLAASSSDTGLLRVTTPPFDTGAGQPGLSCESSLLNIALATSASADPNPANNLFLSSAFYDKSSRAGFGEVCGNGVDDNCDGRADCADPACGCFPQLPATGGGVQCSGGIQAPLPGGPILPSLFCSPATTNAAQHTCTVSRGRCGGVTLPAFCCDPARMSNPSLANLQQLSQCDVGVPGCAPQDPNFKEADPPTNIAGYGYT
ncbi:MAG: hypothetical protein ACRD68_09215, partial [Pyrinomonadaceae bacterium]